MNLPLARRPFPVADRTRDGELYREMHPRLAAIDLLRDKCVDGRAGVDVYDPSVFIVDALPHEIVWVRRCVLLTGILLGERELDRGRVRYRGILEADVQAELDLNIVPPRYVIRDEPLASRSVDAAPEAILHVLHPSAPPHLALVTDNDDQERQPVYRAALDRAARLAALRVDCGCGAPHGTPCDCTVGDRLASAAKNNQEVH